MAATSDCGFICPKTWAVRMRMASTKCAHTAPNSSHEFLGRRNREDQNEKLRMIKNCGVASPLVVPRQLVLAALALGLTGRLQPAQLDAPDLPRDRLGQAGELELADPLVG